MFRRGKNSGITSLGEGRGSVRATNGSGPTPREIPQNPPERTERIERVVEKVVEQHRETLEKLADE